MSLTQALATALSGLRVAQAGLSLVAANVSNAQTPGYVRKTLQQSSTPLGDFGIGVRTTGINRVLDQYVQTQYRTESSGGAYADLRSQFYQRLQGSMATRGRPAASSPAIAISPPRCRLCPPARTTIPRGPALSRARRH